LRFGKVFRPPIGEIYGWRAMMGGYVHAVFIPRRWSGPCSQASVRMTYEICEIPMRLLEDCGTIEYRRYTASDLTTACAAGTALMLKH